MNKKDAYHEDDEVIEQTIEEDDDEFDYEELPVYSEDEDEDVPEEEDLATAIKTLKLKEPLEQTKSEPKAAISKRPEVVDDFIRNFLLRAGLSRTLESFQAEWYELSQKGKLKAEAATSVPDAYLHNQHLEDTVRHLKSELDRVKDAHEKLNSACEKFKKERDFHRMHHKRVGQEKNKLITDIKRLKQHCDKYEPTINELRHKYEVAMKEKMLTKLDRDKLAGKVEILETSIRELEASSKMPADKSDSQLQKTERKKNSKDSVLPSDDRMNPFLSMQYEPINSGSLKCSKTIKGHGMAISSLALHPKKPILATASDDNTWKLWSIPNGDLILSGEGHRDWVAGIDFHPKGTHVASSSGDGTVKVWDLMTSTCAVTFTEHTQAVWAVAFHDQGDFLASASLDHTAKLWDLNSQRCRQTFRGHVDAVNHVVFQPFSNNLTTCSGDKTISLWDARSGLCIQTFYGHMNACNHVAFNIRGDTIASTDADGVVKIWDVRMISERCQVNVGPHPANKLAFDRSGEILAVASDDGTIKILSVSEQRLIGELTGHEDAVLSVAFDNSSQGRYLVSSSADATVRIWTP